MAASEKNRTCESDVNTYAESLDNYLDRRQAAAYIGYSEHYLHRKACEMTGPPYKRLGRKSWYRRVDLDAFMEAEKARKGIENAEGPIDSHKSAKPAAYAFADAFGESHPIIRREPQPGGLHVDSLDGFENWPDGIYVHPHGILVKRSKWR